MKIGKERKKKKKTKIEREEKGGRGKKRIDRKID